MKKLLALILTLVIALSLTACGGETEEEPAPEDENPATEEDAGGEGRVFKVGVCTRAFSSPWQTYCYDVMRSLAEEHPDIELDFQDGQEDANVQVNILQTFIEQEKDLVVVFANQTDTLTAAVNQVVDAGIPVINTQGYVGDGANILTFVGCDDYDNGWGQGQVLHELLEKDGKTLAQLPGPPRECLPIFRESVLPRLRERTGQKRVTRSVRIFGIPEAAAESRLHDRMTASRNPVIAPYVKDGEVEIRLRAWADTEEAAYALTEAPAREIAAEFGDHAYSLNGESLSEVLVRTLRENGLHATAAESCTGGMVTAAITSVAGASEVFDGGVCSYANAVKASLLGVSEETLREHGAVSEACAAEMARGVRKLMGADLAVSVTGIAGPGGGTPEKPVGTVCFGVSTPDGEYTLTRHYRSQGSSVRESNRTRSALEAQFQLLLAARRLGKKQ